MVSAARTMLNVVMASIAKLKLSECGRFRLHGTEAIEFHADRGVSFCTFCLSETAGSCKLDEELERIGEI
jgi:hypothetical protein